jgi:hypothetical protein
MQLGTSYDSTYRAYAVIYDGRSHQVRAWRDPLEARRMVFNDPKKQQTIYFGVLVAQTTSRESALAMPPEHVSPAAAIGNTELWLIPQVECPLCCQRMPGDMADAHLIREHLRP